MGENTWKSYLQLGVNIQNTLKKLSKLNTNKNTGLEYTFLQRKHTNRQRALEKVSPPLITKETQVKTTVRCHRMWETETPVHCWRECKRAQSLQKTIQKLLKKEKCNYHIIQQFHFWEFHSRKSKVGTGAGTHSPLCAAALFTTGRKAKATLVFISGQMDKQMRDTQKMDYHSGLRRKAILTRAPRWIHIEDSALSEISQSGKDKCCVSSLM